MAALGGGRKRKAGGNVVVVTGLSGAGKSTAMSALEDLGYYCVENLPPSVIAHAVESLEARGVRDIALGVGVGVDGFVDEAAKALTDLGAGVSVVFLDASDEAVLRRFSETRRPHPLMMNKEHGEVEGAIRLERERLAPLRALASVVIDTSGLRVHDLRKRVFAMMRSETEEGGRMHTRILSFGFKHGIPSDADLVFDVRFLENPFFVDELRPLTGEDERVRSFVMKSPDAETLVEKLIDLLEFLLPRYEHEGKSYFTIAIGCTGGQHRSVSIARELAERLTSAPAAGNTAGHRQAIRVVHRDARAAALAQVVTPTPGTAAAPPPVGGDR